MNYRQNFTNKTCLVRQPRASASCAVPCRACRIIFIENDNSKMVNRKLKIVNDREANGSGNSPTRERQKKEY